MKLLATSFIAALILASCAKVTETRYHADGSKSVIEQTTPAIKDDTKRFLGDLIRAYSPRPLPPRATK